MLWKTKPAEGDGAVGATEKTQGTSESNGFVSIGGGQEHQRTTAKCVENGTSSASSRRRHGVAIYPFQNQNKDKRLLSLELGDSVVVKDEPVSGWYYGWKKYFPEFPGLFPVSHITTQQKREFADILDKIAEVCREWGEIRKKLFVEGHPYQFDHIGRGIIELVEGRRSLLNQSLTQDQYRELTRKLCVRIDWGNRKLGLDLIPWNWLLEDFQIASETEEEATKSSSIEKERDSFVNILPRCNKEAGKLFKIHQKSAENAASRGSNTLSRPKGKKELVNDLYVCLRDFSYTFTDDCEIAFSLFDGKRFISERYIINQQHAHCPLSNFHMADEHPTIFKDINVHSRRDLYLVVYIVRIGRMFYAESTKKMAMAKRRFRRPYACGVLNLSDVQTLAEEELEITINAYEKPMKLYNSDEKDFWQVHELVVSQNYRNIVSKVIPVLNSFTVSVFWCGANRLNASNKTSNLHMTKMIGFNNIIAPPGVVRNDLYITLSSVDLLEKKQNKTGGTKSCNLEVEIQIIDDEDEIITSLDSNCWKSIILHHVNLPKYNETIKFAIPIEIFPKAKIRCIFRHCSAKDKTEKKMFGITWLNLMDPSGTTVRDRDHQLSIYKWTDEHSLPVHTTSLHLSKDTVVLQTLMISTKFTQNIDLVNLLKWKQTENLKPSLQNLISSSEATEEIVRKFLQDVLDALFTIFSDEDGNSTEYSGDVFTLLVNIFQLLRNSNYSAYKSILNAYCAEHFAAALVYKGLLQSLRHYTTVLLKSVTEDITQLIQNCYSSLQFIFKFVVQSQVLFAKATGGTLEDSFHRDVKTLIKCFCEVFGCMDCSPVFVETQSILLQNFNAVYLELLRVMPLMDVCQLVCEIFQAIPIKESAAHPLSPAKLSAILQVVQSPLFRHSSCRELLLPVFCRHIRHHLAQREELKLCTDVLSEILIYLYDIRHLKEEKAHADVEVVCTTTLEMLVQAILVLERTSTIVGNLVTCLISLLEQMTDCHYNRLWDEFHERKPVRDLLFRVFLLFRDLIKHDVFPTDWAFMKLFTNHVMLTSLHEFCQPLITDFLKFFDVQLWNQYFTLAVTFMCQPELQLEKFHPWKKEWIMEKYGDMRLKMGYQLLQLWSNLGDAERRKFIPSMVGPFLEVTMIPQPELRLVTLQAFFYDMMHTEYTLSGDIKETETELIERLDLLINSETEIEYGDEDYRVRFREVLMDRLKSASNKMPRVKNEWVSLCSSTIESLSNLLQLLLDYRDIARRCVEENRDKLMQCTVNLLQFYREEKRMEQYLRYVHKLHNLHLCTENYTEAGFTLLLHGRLLQWDRDKTLQETYESGGLQFPSQKEAERKEFIYSRVISYFDQGKVWEKAIQLCKELAIQYEKRYDYTRLSRILQMQATFYNNILSQLRPEPEYFRVAFYGQDFPLFVRNKEFIYRGQEYERLGAFIQRITEEWPDAQLLQKSVPPDLKTIESQNQFIQICNVKPKPADIEQSSNIEIPEKIRAFYLVNDVSTFQFDRRIEKEGSPAASDDNEFKSMWIERTVLKTNMVFPGTLKWAEVIEKRVVELCPVEFACEKMEEANESLRTLVGQFTIDENAELKNVNPLSMRLQGMLDAAVMGGIPKYTEAFFNEEFMKKEETTDFVKRLITSLQQQVKILEEGLEIHGRFISPGVQPLHKRLLECHQQMRTSVSETESLVVSTFSILGNNDSTFRRCDSGGNVMRDSFRKMNTGRGGTSIINSPLPPVPKHSPTRMDKPLASSNSNRSSVSSTGGYGHVLSMRMGSSARDIFDDDEDDVYSQPVESNGAPVSNGTTQNNCSKPPLIPSRSKKVFSVGSTGTSDTEYIIMPPSRIREMSMDGQNHSTVCSRPAISPPPTIPPKPTAVAIGSGATSPPPPLHPRKSASTTTTVMPPISKTSSTTSLNSGSADKPGSPPPPPVPPKPKPNCNIQTDEDNTYMNKSELLTEMDSLNKNKCSTPTPTDTIGRRSAGHKEYFVPIAAAKDVNKDDTKDEKSSESKC